MRRHAVRRAARLEWKRHGKAGAIEWVDGARLERLPLLAVTRRSDYRWWVVGTVCIGAFLGQLDASIASLALPTLEHVFDAPVATVEWVAIAYLITVTSVVVAFGHLADLVGRRVLYTAGFVVFIVGSALCGAAPGLGALIAARVLQAVGAAMLQANSVAIITQAVSQRERGRALGIQAAAQAIGLSAGPVVGGLLITTFGWRWVFYVAVPAGLAGALLGMLVLPRTRVFVRGEQFDWAGAIAFGLAIAGLVYLLARPVGGAGPPAWLLLPGVTALFVVFLVVEIRAKSPMVELGLLQERALSLALASGLLAYMLLFGVLFLMPFFLERVWVESSAESGLLLTAIPVGLALAAPVAGRLADRSDLRLLTSAGMGATVLSLALLAQLGREHGALLLVAALAMLGYGIGTFLPSNNTAIMSCAPPARLGVVGGILNLMRGLGTALGIALTGTVLTWRLSVHVGRPVVGTTGLEREVVLLAFHDALLFLGLVALLAMMTSLFRAPAHPRSSDLAEDPELMGL